MIPFAMHLPSRLCGSLFALTTAFIGIATQAAEPPAGAESAEPEFPRHHLSVFAGGVTNFDEGEADRETSAAVGVEYEYRFGRLFGAGLLFEDVFGGEREYIVLAPLSLHPWKGLRLTAGPGADFRSGDTEFVFRAGVGYEFELGHGWTLAPEIAGDFTHEAKTLVFGVSAGWGF